MGVVDSGFWARVGGKETGAVASGGEGIVIEEAGQMESLEGRTGELDNSSSSWIVVTDERDLT